MGTQLSAGCEPDKERNERTVNEGINMSRYEMRHKVINVYLFTLHLSDEYALCSSCKHTHTVPQNCCRSLDQILRTLGQC